MKQFLARQVLILFILGIAAGCAATTKGKFQQTGKAVIEIGKAVSSACAESKAKGWKKPLTLNICLKASVAYDGAWATTKLAVAVIDAGGKPGFDTMVRIGTFVLDMVKLLREAGVAIPESTVKFVEKDISAILAR